MAIEFNNQADRDHYQIAENTPANRHAFDCPSPGLGTLVINLYHSQLCNCWVIVEARKIKTTTD